jgi:hypothetical protein
MGLTRDQFRTQVFARDKHLCVVPGCTAKAVDSHHIVERACWTKGDPNPEGYLLANGASLCETHHIHAEKNYYPPQALRNWLNLPTVLPACFDPAKLYDKWGNEIAPAVNGKYPKTPYLPFSPTADEDKAVALADLVGKPLVVTVKMDGSNVTLTREKVAARNGDTAHPPEFDPLKALHAGFRHAIPDNVLVYGEWLFARHTIAYEGGLALPSPLLILAVYDQMQQLFWSWSETVTFAAQLGFPTVPLIGGGVKTFDAEWRLTRGVVELAEQAVKAGHEGVVVRNIYPFHFTQFGENTGKYVRAGFKPGVHLGGKIIKNEVRK